MLNILMKKIIIFCPSFSLVLVLISSIRAIVHVILSMLLMSKVGTLRTGKFAYYNFLIIAFLLSAVTDGAPRSLVLIRHKLGLTAMLTSIIARRGSTFACLELFRKSLRLHHKT